MAEVVVERTRKPSVIDTLDDARHALSTHRQWLRRRDTSESFGVTFEAWTSAADEERGGEWTFADVEDEETLHNGKRHSPTQSRAASTPAPPTQTARKIAGQLLKRKVSCSKVSPAPLLQSPEEEEEQQQITTANSGVGWATSAGELTGRDGGKTQEKKEECLQDPPKSKRRKVKWASRVSVAPATHNSSPDTLTTTTPLHLFTSPLPATPRALPRPSNPTPPPGGALAAWGSLSSLDNYMESLEIQGTKSVETATSSSPPKGGPSPSMTLHISSGGGSEEGEQDATHISRTTEDAKHTPGDVSVSIDCSPQENSAPEERAYQQPSGETVDISALQSESTATVLPVEPAPRESQSSYEVHHHSKLDQVGQGLKVIEISARGPSPLESDGSQVRITSGNRTSAVRNITTPEPVVEDVQPCGSMSGGSGVQSRDLGSNHEALEPGTLTTSSSSALDEAVINATVRQESEATEAASQIRGGEMGGGASVGGRSSEESDITFHPQVTSTPSSAPEEEVKSELGSDERRRQILEDLRLPRLKERGARSILSRLPRLKSTTPTSPTTPGIATELKLSRKRSQEVPSYASHHRRTAGQALNPPCPQYGVRQPKDLSLERKRLYSTPSSNPNPSPPHSPLAISTRAWINSLSHVSQHVDTSPPPSPVRKKPSRPSSAKQQRTHVPLRHTVSSPTGSPGREEEGGMVRRGSTGLDSPLLKSQISHDKNSVDGGNFRGSTHSLYLLHTGPGPLHLAAKHGNLRQLQYLISEGESVDVRDHEGRTPLMYCIHSRGVHLSCASFLIESGASLNKQSSDGSTAIHLASAVGAISLIEFAIINHADPDIRDFEGRLPVHWATMSLRSSKCAALLLKIPATLSHSAVSLDRQTVPPYAIRFNGHSKLDINAVDDAGMTSLMWAAYNNNPIVTEFLLSKGADCEEKDMDGMTAMHWAIHQEGVRCLELLLKADHTYFKDHKGRTVLHVSAEVGCVAACELVLGLRGDAVHDLDRMGRTPLHYAAACSRVDVCALLLDRGSDASQRDLAGKTAIEYARQKKLDYVVALLTCHGTAVADFAKTSRSTSVSSLLNRATSFSQLPTSGETPDIITESLQPLPANHTDSGTSDEIDNSLLYKGAFLGRFVPDRNDPVQHFFFWLAEQTSQLHWSRERNRRRSRTATVYEVHGGPSRGLRENPAYSPEELHQHMFWVLTDSGVFDLMAYNESAYHQWVSGLGEIARGAPETAPEGTLGDKNSPRGPQTVWFGPQQSEPKKSLRHKTRRSAVVAPALVVENEARDSSSLNNTATEKLGSSVTSCNSELTETTPTPIKRSETNQPSLSQGPPQQNMDDII